MPQALDSLIENLALEPLERDLFRGVSPQTGRQRVFGGQVVAQALAAACRTVEAHTVHSLHAYFLLPGDPAVPIVYKVERIRDGRSFTTRRVVAIQHGRAIFFMSASFHKAEGGFDHQISMPQVPPPDKLPGEAELISRFIDRMPDSMRRYLQRERPIELRPVEAARYMSKDRRAPAQNVWFRATGPLPDDPALHRCVLAYASDMTLLDTALLAHGRSIFDQDLQLASLDHALWFHRPCRVDEWLLYAQDSPSAAGAKGFNRGSIFTADGLLAASVAQEGLIRRIDVERPAKNR